MCVGAKFPLGCGTDGGDMTLFLQYGEGAEVPPLVLESTLVTGWVPTLLRAGRGMSRFEGAQEAAPVLELYGFENDGECRLVREALCEMEIPYNLINAGRGVRSIPRIPRVPSLLLFLPLPANQTARLCCVAGQSCSTAGDSNVLSHPWPHGRSLCVAQAS